MATFSVKVTVEYEYEVEAETEAEAEEQGWQYEDYKQFATVDSIQVEQTDEDEEEDGEE